MECVWPTRQGQPEGWAGQRARGSGFSAPDPLPQCSELGHSKELHFWENVFVWGQEGIRIQEILGHTTMPKQGGEGVLGYLLKENWYL